MTKQVSKTEATLIESVATLTVDEAVALSKTKTGEYLKAKRTADQTVGSAMFAPAVVLNRLIHLGAVVDGRRKGTDQSISFGTWGKDNGITASATVSLFKSLARAVDHGITPASDPVTWAHLVQFGTKAHVTTALAKNPGPKNTEAVRKACVEVDNGTAPKPKRASKTGDEKKTETVTGLTVGNIEQAIVAVRSWVEAPGNLSALSAEALATIHAHLSDMAEAFEAEGHRAATASRKTVKPSDLKVARAV